MVSEESYLELYDLISSSKDKRILPHNPVEGLTDVEARVVMFTSRAEEHFEEVRPRVLSQVSKMTPSALSQIIKSLTKKGIVERKHHSADYRAVYITLTPKGKEYAQQIEASHREHFRALADYLGEEDLTNLIRIAKKIDDFHKQGSGDSKETDASASLLAIGRSLLFDDKEQNA